MKRFKQRGLTSLMVLLFMVVALTFMLGLSAQSMGTLKRAQNDADAALALQGAQRAAEAQILIAFENGFKEMETDLTDMSQSFTPGSTAWGSVEVAGGGRYWVTGYCTVNGVTKSVRMLVKDVKGHGVWDNALFARDFVDADNMNVHGSVHILGDVLGKNGYVYDIEMSALVANNYYGMPWNLESRVPPLEIVNGKESLEAEYRVRKGKSRFTGGSSAGQAVDPDAGTSKGYLDGVYTVDGVDGNVYSDNGQNEPYDKGEPPLEYPTLDDPYTDQFGVTWLTHRDFLDNRSLVIAEEKFKDDSSFEYSPDAYGNWIRFTPEGGGNPALLEINGIVKIDSPKFKMDLGVLHYKGRGTIYAPDEMILYNDLLPAPGETFPTTSVLGLIAGGYMKQEWVIKPGVGHRAGAFFSGSQMKLDNHVHIAGTVVAQDFRVEVTIPTLYQVPLLSKNLPPGMPGADAQGGGVKVLTWRKRSHSETNK